MTYPCAFCGATASADAGCPTCGRGPDPDAIEVIRTDAEITTLIGQLATARQAVHELETRIGHAWQRRNAAAARVRAALRPESPVPTSVPARPEASSRLVQNVLFLLGGLLLAIAAVVFTAVAWHQFGVAGRAALLALCTLAVLAVPPLALRRGLTATAETMAAVGLLLILLDGYAAWYVNLFGLSAGSPLRYAGVVFAVAAAVAAGYARATGLTGPRYAALLLAQPVLPLLVAPAHPGPAGWTLTFGAVAALDFAAARARVAALAYPLGALAVVLALARAAGAALDTLRTARPAFHAAWDAAVPAAGWSLPAAFALVTAVLAVTVAPRWRPGTVLGGAAAVALTLPAGLHLPWWEAPLLDLVVAAAALAMAARHAAPALAGPAARVAALPAVASPSAASAVASFGGQVVAALLLVAHAVAAGFGRPAAATTVLGAVALLGFGTAALARHPALGGTGLIAGLLAVPAIAWTATAALSLPATAQARAVVVAVAVVVAALRVLPGRPFALVAGLLAILPLPLWAFLAGDPVAVYAALGLLLLALATTRRTWPPVPLAGGVPSSAAADSGASGPGASGSGASGSGASGLGASGPGASGLGAWPVVNRWAAVAGSVTAVPLAVVLVATVAPAALRVLLPTDSVWAGLPAGVPHVAAADAMAALIVAVAVAVVVRNRWAALAAAAAALPLVLAAAGVPWPVLPFAELLLGLAGLLLAALRRVPTAVPAVGVLLAAAGLGGALLTRPSTLAALGVVLIAAAVAGSAGRAAAARIAGWLSAVGAGLGVAVTVGSMLGLRSHTAAFLVLAAAAAAFALAWRLPAGRTAPRSHAASPRAGEARAVEAAAHAGAGLALLLTLGSAGHAAAICTLWGLVLGMRALRPPDRSRYLVAAAVAELGGWLLLLVAARVAVLEAYTIPAAAVALLAGFVAGRNRVSSWIAYGPALAAALLPSLASVLVADGQYARRLLLGLAALAVLLAGAHARLRAPVVIGGAVLIVAALRELAAVWDLVPRWIPLAAAGLLLVLLATTLERRRRDLTRFRTALGRMT